MKSTIKLFAALTLGVFIIWACSKDQKVVNQLEGTWNVTNEKINGVDQPDSTYKGTTYKFEKCKVKKGACPGTIIDDGKSFPFTYEITDKGKKITVNMAGFTSTSDILEHSKTRFRWRTTDGSDVTETTIEKQ